LIHGSTDIKREFAVSGRQAALYGVSNNGINSVKLPFSNPVLKIQRENFYHTERILLEYIIEKY
jgi:hypothetical protein